MLISSEKKEPLLYYNISIIKIEVARGNGGDKIDICHYAQQYRNADDEGKEILEHIIKMVIEHGKFFHEELKKTKKSQFTSIN